MKKRILSLTLTICLLLGAAGTFTPAAGAAGPSDWALNAIEYPKKDDLNPCGPVKIKWQNISAFGGTAPSYNVYVNGALQGSIPQTDEEHLTFEWYSTAVARHTVRIEAVGAGISAEADFFLSKKGTPFFGMTMEKMEDMNLGWYYNWEMAPDNTPAVRHLDYTPMIWGENDVPFLSTGELNGYDTILGFNEPDLVGQADMSVERAAELWPEFVATGKRLGAPVMAWNYEGWLDPFLAKVDNQVDFIPVHIYYGPTVSGVMNSLELLYRKYNKPIWITELSAANFGGWQQDNIGGWGYTQEMVYDFLRELLPLLDAAPFVERYAWFSFLDTDPSYSYSALFRNEIGELTALGEIYRDLGNPFGTEGFVPANDIISVDTAVVMGTPLALTGQVLPVNATNRTITWSVTDAGTTGAVIIGNTLQAEAAGTVTVTAVITNGLSSGVAFTKQFSVAVMDSSAASNWEKTAIISPALNTLIPVGPVEIKWKNIGSAGGNVPYYNVYVNGNLLGKVPQSVDEFLAFTWSFVNAARYTVSVRPAGTDLFAEVHLRIYDDEVIPLSMPGSWPEQGDRIVLRSDYNGMYVRPGAIPDIDTMVADQAMLTEENLAECTFEVIRRFGCIFLRAYNQKIVLICSPGQGWTYNKILPQLTNTEWARREHILFFIPQDDNTFKISSEAGWADVLPDGSLYAVYDAVPGDTGKFTWEKVGSAYSPGITVTGQVRSYNPNNPAELKLIRFGDGLTYETAIDKDGGSGQTTQPFAFDSVEPGDYTLVITKPGHTSYTIQKITVGAENVNLSDTVMTLLCGDISGDDMINDGDLAVLWLAANYNKSASDPSVNKLCDLNGDDMVNDGDLAILWLAANYNKGAVVVG